MLRYCSGILLILTSFLMMFITVYCGRIPLKADDDVHNTMDSRDRSPGCVFDGHTYELEDTWHPDLGPPFGVMYCVKCECIAMPRKGQITGKVRCRNFKHECPKPDCPEPVLLPNQCCKVCPRDSSGTTRPAFNRPEADAVQEAPRSAEYLAVLSNPANRHAARAVFHFEAAAIHYTLHFAPGFQANTVIFQDETGNAVFTQAIEEGRISGRKYCGVWDRIPRMFRRTLAKETMQIALTTSDDPRPNTKGNIILKRQTHEETYSALLLPRDHRKYGMTAIASIAIGADGNSFEFSVFIQGITMPRKDVRQIATVILERTDDRVVIKEAASAIAPKAFEVSGRMADLNLNSHDMIRWLARGKLALSLRLSSAADVDLVGIIHIKPTCNIFQAVLYDSSRSKPEMPGAGVALLELKPDGTVDYRVHLQRFPGRPAHMTLETNPRKGRRRIVDDITGSFVSGWTNGTYTKQIPKDLQSLLSDDWVISISNDNSGTRMQGQIKQVLYDEVYTRLFPNILPENPSASFMRDVSGSAVAWLRLDENCILNYHIFIDGYADVYVKKLQTTMTYMYDQYGNHIRKQSQLDNFKKNKLIGRVKNLKNDVLMGMPNGTIEILITARDEVEPRLRGHVKLIDDCSSRHKFNGFVMEDPANTVVPTYTCQYQDKSYEDGSSWKSEHKECTMCSCQRGRIVCEEMVCPKVTCRNPVRIEGECCMSCPQVHAPPKIMAIHPGSVAVLGQTNSTPAGCYLDKKWHKPGSSWHPYIVPFGHSKCAVCTCMPGTNVVNCTKISCPALECDEAEAIRENPADCCKKCPEAVTVTSMSRPPNDTMGDQGIITLPEDILRDGGCRFQAETFRNGAEWHPRVQPFGVMNCVLCRCKDGKPSCKRQKCPKLTCPFIRKESNECCPRCTDQDDPKARANRRLSNANRRRKQRTRRRE